MNYMQIKKCDISNGPGIRTSLFVSGCSVCCKGCFNREAWDFDAGTLYTEETQDTILETLNNRFVDGLSILGGDPLEPDNVETVLSLVRKTRYLHPDKTIWLYTGRRFDYIVGTLHDPEYVTWDGITWAEEDPNPFYMGEALFDTFKLKEVSRSAFCVPYPILPIDYVKNVMSLIHQLDVLVDGAFIEKEKDLTLRFRGSRNQRLIDIKKSIEERQVALWDN